MSFVPTFLFINSVEFLFKSCRICVSSFHKALSESNCRHNGSQTTADCRSVDIRLSAVPEPAGRLSGSGTHRAGLSTAGSHRSCCCCPAIGSGTAGGMARMSCFDRAAAGAGVAAAGSHLGTGCCSCSAERRCCIAAGCCPRTSTAPDVAADDRILGCCDSLLGYPERRCGLRNGRKL